MKTSSDDKIPVKYVLYSHYANEEKKDFEDWDSKKRNLSDLKGINFLMSRIQALRDLLTSPGYEGFVVLFYAPGLLECFDGIEEEKTLKQLLEEHAKLRFAEAVSRYVTEELRKDIQMLRRVRFVTPLDLHEIFGRVSADEAEHLRWWFIGDTTDIRYDTPKIVEAIVRLRLLGNGVPVFRLDWDVLFSSEAESVTDLGLFKPVVTCLKAYRLRLDDPTVATFIFSASYDTRQLRDSLRGATFKDWRGAFATRVFPALPIVPDLLARVGKKELSWEEYAEQAFNQPVGNDERLGERLAQKFYGLRLNRLPSDGINGLTKVGAHPLVSVISGAFLCLSDGAILDLPPFSNFSRNVSWIDDHLKYCLHRELRHLTSLDLRLAEPALSDAMLDEVMVSKARGKIDNLPSYVLGNYLPTLLWGTVCDAWINPDPLLKCRPDPDYLSDEEIRRWHALPRSGKSGALLPSHLQTALETGHFKNADRLRLRRLLNAEALARITEVRNIWSQLTDSGYESFASIWAKGVANQYFPTLPEKCWGIAPGKPLTTPLADEAHLNAFLVRDFSQVVEDALMYIDWTLHWPGIVRIVRSIEQGSIRTDMGWKPE